MNAMEFFGIGAPELMVVLVIAILLFGPDKIPSMAQQVGKTIREFRRYTSELTKEFDAATGDLRSEFQTIAGDLKGELAATQADLRSQLDLTDVFKMDTPKEAVAATVAAGGTETAAPTLAAETLAASDAVTDPEPTKTITVTTPYAEALAAEAVVAEVTPEPIATNGTRTATKADPFADLATLTVAEQATEPVTVFESAPVAQFATVEASSDALAATSVSHEPEPAATNGHAKVIGGSVAGSKYARRKSRAVAR